MAVASTNGEDTKTGHSTFGPWVDIAAPGTDIVTTDLGNEYIATAGTSFSSPYVAAVAALLFAHRPKLTPIQVRAILENTTDPLYYGDLDPNLCYIGTGRVNAYKALPGRRTSDYPLGEIRRAAAPGRRTRPTAIAIDLCRVRARRFLSARLPPLRPDRLDGDRPGPSPTADPNGLVHVSLANPGVGTYELRLRVSRGAYTHTDRAVFGDRAGAGAGPLAQAQGRWTTESLLYFMGNPLCLDLNGDGRNEIIQASLDYTRFLLGERASSTSGPRTATRCRIGPWSWSTPGRRASPSETSTATATTKWSWPASTTARCTPTTSKAARSWTATGRSSVGGWCGYIAAGPVLADLDGDGVSEILVALDVESRDTRRPVSRCRAMGPSCGSGATRRKGRSASPTSTRTASRRSPCAGTAPASSSVYTFILDSQGQQIARWKGGSQKGTVVADLNGDGKTEMVFCTEEDVEAVRADGTHGLEGQGAGPVRHQGRPERRRPQRRRSERGLRQQLRRGRRIHLQPGLWVRLTRASR